MNPFIGNHNAVSYFNSIIDRHQGSFVLLTGPQYIGKTTLIQSKIDQIISPFHMGSDYRFIQDLSDQRLELKEINDKLTGTEHAIKIEGDSSKRNIKLQDGEIYQDRGAREMIDRLVKSPIGGTKLLVIENIERMTTQASNALLKTLEEPHPNRIIIGTSSNANQLLDTIKSRATIIQFQPVEDIERKNNNFEFGILNFELLMGRPGLARRFQHTPKYQELASDIKHITKDRWNKELISHKQSVFMKAHNQGLLQLILDILLVKFANEKDISSKLLLSKKYLESNTTVPNIIMNMCL